MVGSGNTSSKRIRPILVDDDGRVYVNLYDSTVDIGNINLDGSNNQYVIPTDGHHEINIERDVGTVSALSYQQTVICLNYVWNGAAWVRMTQP